MANVEDIKKNSRHLRGGIEATLTGDATHFGEDDERTLKFHGCYQQENRDERVARIRAKVEAAHNLMVRTKIPGGTLAGEQYLALDSFTDLFATGTLRITSRQDIQYHGVLKKNLKQLIAGINKSAKLLTWGGCGDVARNVMATPAPMNTPIHREVQRTALEISNALLPNSRAYFEIWLDEKKMDASAETEPLYGDTYLPRKFKTAIAIEPRNDIDIYTHDLGFVPYVVNGEIEGYTVLAGGGQGMDHGKEATYPYLAKPMVYVRKEHVVATARAVLAIFRDYGDRTNRKHARLKYVIAERGVEWFVNELKNRLSGIKTETPKALKFTSLADPLGWTAQGDGKFFYGVRVENGRIADDKIKFRSAFREIVEKFKCPVRLTPNQNILFYNLEESARAPLEKILAANGVPGPETYSAARKMSMSCVALPTCGLALSESERVFGKLMDEIDAVLKELGLEQDPILFRMTGCPNGCARPYNTDFGFVGKGPGKYAVYIGGSNVGDRMSGLVYKTVPLDQIAEKIKPILAEYVKGRQTGESFTSYWARTHKIGPAPHSSQFHVELAEREKRLNGGGADPA